MRMHVRGRLGASSGRRTNVRGRVGVEFLFAADAAEEILGAREHAAACRGLLVDLHSTYRINCHRLHAISPRTIVDGSLGAATALVLRFLSSVGDIHTIASARHGGFQLIRGGQSLVVLHGNFSCRERRFYLTDPANRPKCVRHFADAPARPNSPCSALRD